MLPNIVELAATTLSSAPEDISLRKTAVYDLNFIVDLCCRIMRSLLRNGSRFKVRRRRVHKGVKMVTRQSDKDKQT